MPLFSRLICLKEWPLVKVQHIPLNWLWTVARHGYESLLNTSACILCVYFTVYRSTTFSSKSCGYDDFIKSKLTRNHFSREFCSTMAPKAWMMHSLNVLLKLSHRILFRVRHWPQCWLLVLCNSNTLMFRSFSTFVWIASVQLEHVKAQ